MPGAHLYIWDDSTNNWIKAKGTSAGKLIIDPVLLFENPPTEDETKKGPSSEWAFDHDADASAHHARYTDTESRAAINDIHDANGYLTTTLRARYYGIIQLSLFQLQNAAGDSRSVKWTTPNDLAITYVTGYQSGVGNIAAEIHIYDGSAYKKVIDQGNLLSEYSSAKGTQNWSTNGFSFMPLNPDTDQVTRSLADGGITANADGITFVCPVNLPDGATVTSAKVWGNAGATAETWILVRISLDDHTSESMATAAIGTADTSISYATIDNSSYAYAFVTSSIDTNDEIYGALITFTL